MKAEKQKRSLALAISAIALAIATGAYASQEPKPANPVVAQPVSAARSSDKPDKQDKQDKQDKLDSLSAAEFSRLSCELSEESGYFRSDNFTSNETAYLTVVDKLRSLGATGGAYVGVGPEQNFTYIAKIRPRIAFIVDIRRQAIIQHLMYKAVFHLAPDRIQFLSRLLSRPAPKEKAAKLDASVNEMLAYFSQAPADERAYAANLAAIRRAIQEDFQFPLSDADQRSLEYVYKSFRDDGLEIAYRMGDSRGGYFPMLKDLIAQTDLDRKSVV